jgi:hypothetical protein
MDLSLEDILKKRLQQSTQPFTDPASYLTNRLIDDIGGSPDAGPAEQNSQYQFQPQQQQNYTAPTPNLSIAPSPQAMSAAQQFLTPQAQTQQQAQPEMTVNPQPMQHQQPVAPEPTITPPAQTEPVAQQTTTTQQPQHLVGTMPIQPAVFNPNQPPAQMTPAVQTTPAPENTQQVQPTEQQWANAPDWAKEMKAASESNNPEQWHNIAGNPNYPSDVKQHAGEKAFELLKAQQNKEQAEKRIQLAVQVGDPKAQNEMMRDLKSTRENNGIGAWTQAILLQRLGFKEAADNKVKEIMSGGNVESAQLNGKHYSLDKDIGGNITRAWDEHGKRVDNDTLAQLQAGAVKVGTQAYGFTGGSMVIPQGDTNAGQEYRQRTNAMTGDIENIITTGPNAGQKYTGAPGVEKRVGSQYLIGQNSLIMDLMKKHNNNVYDALKDFEQYKGPLSPEDRAEFLSRYGYQQPSQGYVPQPPAVTPKLEGRSGLTPQSASPQESLINPSAIQSTVYRPNQEAQLQPAFQEGQPANGMMKTGLDLSTPISQLKQQRELGTKAGEAQIGIQQKRSENYNKYLDEEIGQEARKADSIAQERRRQFQIFDRPGVDADKIFGLYNAAQEHPGEQKWSIVRDIIGGKFKEPDDVSQRLAQLNLDPATRSALEEYNLSNANINKSTLKQTAGAGGVSDAEQEANRKSNVEPTKIPALAAYNGIAQSQFYADQARYKADWAATHDFANTLQLDRAWRKEQQRLNSMYGDIAEKRIKFINDNGNTTNAVKQGYKKYPVPEYDVNSEKWIKTKPLTEILGR